MFPELVKKALSRYTNEFLYILMFTRGMLTQHTVVIVVSVIILMKV